MGYLIYLYLPTRFLSSINKNIKKKEIACSRGFPQTKARGFINKGACFFISYPELAGDKTTEPVAKLGQPAAKIRQNPLLFAVCHIYFLSSDAIF